MDIYSLSRSFWDWSYENPEKIKPNHSALYFFAIEHCNRLGWKEKFRLPATMAMEAIGIRSYNTYKSTFDDLVTWGFITLIEKAKNQYSSNTIALSKFDRANEKALDKALIGHSNRLIPPIPSEEIEPEFSPEISKRIKEATEKIAGFFNISEIRQPNHWMKIRNFIEFQARKTNLDYLADQFTAYRKLKEKKGFKHTWMNWIGQPSDHPEPYAEGAWNLENWSELLKDYIKTESKNPSPNVSTMDYSKLHEHTLKIAQS